MLGRLALTAVAVVAAFATPGSGNICASRSTAVGITTTAATAGARASFTIQARDEFGQLETATDQPFVVALEREGPGPVSTLSVRMEPMVPPAGVYGVTIAAGGSGCTAGGTLSASVPPGQSGSGFSATFTQSGGVIDAVTVTAEGSGYTATPTLAIASGGAGCTGYALTALATLVGEHYGGVFTTVSGAYRVAPSLVAEGGLNASYYANLWLSGEPGLRTVEPSLEFDWGVGAVAPGAAERASARWEGVLRGPPGVWPGGSLPPGGVYRVDILKPGSGCTAGGTLSASGGGGSGFSATFTHATLIDADGAEVSGIDAVTVVSRGAGYAAEPSLAVASGGSGCAGFKLAAVLTEGGGGGETVFRAETDGAVRLWIDSSLVIDQWGLRAPPPADPSAPQRQCASPGAGKCPPGAPAGQCSAGAATRHALAPAAGGFRVITTNACPPHVWAPSRTPHAPLSQAIAAVVPSHPVMSAYPTAVGHLRGRPLQGVVGYAADGVPIHGPSDAAGGDAGVGLDACGGHADSPGGAYHYHRDPSCAYEGAPGAHSPLAGLMLDGVPLYGPLDVGGLPASSLEGPGALDECGGHVDEEHPFYHYHTRAGYPHTVECLRGCVPPEAAAAPGVLLPASGLTCVPAGRQYAYGSLANLTWGAGEAPSAGAANRTFTYAGSRALAPGGLHPFKLEYRHQEGPAFLRLSWSPGLGGFSPVPAASLLYAFPMRACGDAPCASARLAVQAAAASAAACSVSPVANMLPNASSFPARLPFPFDPFEGTFGLGWESPFASPNYISRAGTVVFHAESRDEFGNARDQGGDAFTVEHLRVVHSGTARRGSASSVVLSSSASDRDAAYEGMYVDLTAGTGAGQRVVVTRYTGATRTALATFATAPDPTSVYAVGPVGSLQADDMRNGSHRVAGQLTVAANYTVWVRLSGSHVSGSPFYVHVVPGAFEASTSQLSVPLVWTSGEPSSLTIVARDTYGNNVSSSDAFPAYSDTCQSACAPVRFSVMVKSSAAVSKEDVGSVAAANTASSFTLGSTASASAGAYVGMAINIGGFTRNISHHGAAASSSAADGRVVTVGTAFATAPSAGDAYFVTKFEALVPTTKRVCKMSGGEDGRSYVGTCPALMQAGEYTVEAASAGRALQASPRKVVVHPSWKCASQSRAYGMGLTLATVAAAASFTIATKDSFGQASTRGGDAFAVSADRPGSASLQFFSYCSPSLSCVQSSAGSGTISDRNTGTYAVSYTPTVSGRYSVDVKLGGISKVHRSPFDLIVRAGALCTTKSVARGTGLTIATTGMQGRFTVEAKDAYGNSVEQLDDSTLDCAPGGTAGACKLTMTVGTQVEERFPGVGSPGWEVAYMVDRTFPTQSVTTTLAVNGNPVGNRVGGGLFATYYNGDVLEVPIVTAVDPVVDFSGSGFGGELETGAWPWQGDVHRSLQATGTCLVSNDNFAVRWAGQLHRPAEGKPYTFSARVHGATERVKLWIDNKLVIEQWLSLSTLSPTGTFEFSRGYEGYDIQLDYKELSGAGAASRQAQLVWSGGGGGPIPAVVPSSSLYRTRSDFTTLVATDTAVATGGGSCASLSVASGNGLTIATAGTSAYATITAKDSVGAATELDAATQALSFTARAGRTQGGLQATYYAGSGLLPANASSTRQDGPVNFAGGSSTLAKALRVPTPADPATVVNVASAAALGTAAGSNINVGGEVMRVVAISSDELTVSRGQVGTAAVAHDLAAAVYTVPTVTLAGVEGYSARWAGQARPQYAGQYTWYAGVAGADERVKLWVDGVLLLDQWSSITATEVGATWDSLYAGGYAELVLEYKNPTALDGTTLSWEHASQVKAVVTSERLFAGVATARGELGDMSDGTYRVRHTLTHAGAYHAAVGLHTAGGLQATYYQDANCYSSALYRKDEAVDFDWGILSPHPSVPSDGFCVRWAGWVRPDYTGEYTIGVRADDAATLWFDHRRVIDETVDGQAVEWGATVDLSAGRMYPVELRYREISGMASATLRWSSALMPRSTVASIDFAPATCDAEWGGLPLPRSAQAFDCLSSSGQELSGGMWYLAGDFEVLGAPGGANARGTFTVNAHGSVNATSLAHAGAAYATTPTARNVSIYYRGTRERQEGTVSSVSVDSAGTNYVAGRVRVTGGTADAGGELHVVPATGAVNFINITSHGAGFGLPLTSANVFLLYASTGEPMSGSVTSVTVGGTQTTAYTEDASATVTCNTPCTGSGFAATCSVRAGTVIFLVVSAHGTGYTQANPPTVACPGGAGQTFTPNVAEGAVASPRVAVGATLQPRMSAGRAEVIPSSRLYYRTDFPTPPWELTVSPAAYCGTTSTVTYGGLGWAPSSATVGNPGSFTIQARDEYGNARAGAAGTDFFTARLGGSSYEVLQYEGSGITATAGVTGQYTFSLTAAQHSQAGVRPLHVGLATVGGLFATYYAGANFTEGVADPYVWPGAGVPASVVTSATVDFSQAANTASTVAQTWPTSPACLVSALYPFKARWSGFFKQSAGTATYTFSATLGQTDERVRLWVSNVLVIDQWSSLATLTPAAAPASYTVNVPYSVELEYKVRGGALRTVQLQQTTGGATTVVPSSSLFRSYHLAWPGVAQSSHTANASWAGVSAANSLLSGVAVSLATSSLSATFTITARDTYSNARGGREDFFRVSITQAGVPSVIAGVSNGAEQGTYVASYRLTSSGAHTIAVATPFSGGLTATYFSTSAFTDARYIRVDTMAPLAGTGDVSSTTDWPGDVNQALDGTAFSVRWEGFVRPPVASVFKFTAAMGSADERVKLWVDNKIVIEQWISLDSAVATGTVQFAASDAYYDVKLDYKEVTGGAQAMDLRWALAPSTTVTIDDRGCAGASAACAGTTAGVSTVGDWGQYTGSGLDSTYSSDENVFKGNKFFVYSFPEAFGVYTVYEYHPASGTYATNAALNITHSSGTSQFVVDQTADGSAWNQLGTFCFTAGATITIGNEGTTATVVADGVRLVRTSPASERVLDCGHFAVSQDNARKFLLATSASAVSGAYLNKFMTIGSERRNIYGYDGKRQATTDQVFSLGTTTLSSAIAAAATTMNVVSGTDAGIIVGREVEVDEEIIYVSADLGGNAFTVVRGQHDTSDVAHISGAEVRTVLRPGQVVENGVIAATAAANKVTLAATSSPVLADVFVGSSITIGFEHAQETRTITAYSAARVCTVNPPFTGTLVAGTSAYTIFLQSVYTVTDEPLRDEGGSACLDAPMCSIVPSYLYSSPRSESTVTLGVGAGRVLVATGAELALATAGVAGSFTVTVRDNFGTDLPYDAATVVFANLTLLTSTYGYGKIALTSGLVATAGDEYTFTLDATAPATADTYLGFLISIGTETRTIVSYTAGRVVNVNVPFGSAPTTSSIWTVSAEEAGHAWFPASASFSASTSAANPSTVSYTATAAGMYRLEVNAHKVGGLQGNYYHNIYLQGQPSLTRVDQTVDFDWGTGLITNTARSFVGVRWTGLVRPLYTETYTFLTNTTGLGPRLVVAGTQLVNELATEHGCREWDPKRNCLWRAPSWKWNWDGSSTGVQGAYHATVAMTGSSYYDLLLDYRVRVGAASVQLWWMSASQRLEPVPSTRLYYPFQSVTGAPLSLKVEPSPTFCSETTTFTTDHGKRCTTCGTVGSVRGVGLTLATAGVATTFNLQTKDQYGNLHMTASALAFSRVESDPECGAVGTGRRKSGNCTATLATTPTQTQVAGLNKFSYTTNVDSGSTTVSAGLLSIGGLFATYYSACRDIVNTAPKVGSGVYRVNVTAMGSSCTADGTLSAYGGGAGATGFVATFKNRGGSAADVIVTSAGHSFSATPTVACCGQVYAVAVSGTASSPYTSGGALGVSCTGGCTGTGLAGTCTTTNAGTVTAVVITERGNGYDSANPPTLTCAGGAGQTFTPSIDASTGGTGCLGVLFAAEMQFENVGQTWEDSEPRALNSWYSSDVGSAGGTLTGCPDPVPYRVRLDATLDFSGSTGRTVSDWPGTANTVQEGDSFQVRWAGFVKPAGTGEYTFTALVLGDEERVKLWVDNSVLIDQWTSLTATSVSATTNFASATYFPIAVEYRDDVSTQQATLQWAGAGDGPGVIASTAMYAAYHAVGSPSVLKVYPDIPCATLSSPSGSGLSLATAGVLASFTLTARDQFGNIRQALNDEAKGYMYKTMVTPASTALRTVETALADSGDGILTYSYNTTTSGTVTLQAFVAKAGGLHATYFDTEALATGLHVREDATVDWSGTGDAASTTEWPGATGESVDGSSFSVKWRGFLRAPYPNVYTFTAKLEQSASVGDRVKIWIDNKIVIEQWISLSSRSPTGTFLFEKSEHLYDIVADYKHTSGDQQFSLYWVSDGGQHAAVACDFTSPAATPPTNTYSLSAFHVDMCGWQVGSACDSDASLCALSQQKTSSGDAQFETLTGAAAFGEAVAWCGDMDGDGVEDIVVGAPGDDGTATNSGAVYILLVDTTGALKTSNLAAGVSYRKIADNSNFAGCTACLAASDEFGKQVAVFPDMDANGLKEIAVASTGSVWVLYMARDTTATCEVCPPTVSSYVELDVSATVAVVPTAMAVWIDTEGDGVLDIIIGNSGATDGAIYVMGLTSTGCAGGAAICLTGTVTTIAASTSGFTGSCTGGGGAACLFGSSLAVVGDVDGDAVPDLAVGSEGDDCGGTDRGAVWILIMDPDVNLHPDHVTTVRRNVRICSASAGMPSGLIATDGSLFGSSISPAGDLNGDGVPDIVVGSPKELLVGATWKGGIYFIALSRRGTVVDAHLWGGPSDYQITQANDQAMGYAVAAKQDHNRDGMGPDIVSGQALEGSGLGTVSVLLPAGWTKWLSGGSSVGSTPTASTGPATALSGIYTQYSTGKRCNDGTKYLSLAGSTLNGEYSFLFKGTDAACATRCSNDPLCNFYTTGASSLCETARSCYREDASTDDATTVTYQKGSFLYLDSQYIGSNAAPGETYFTSPPGLYTELSFYYHMYGAGVGSLHAEVRSSFEVVDSGVVSAIDVNETLITLDSIATGASGAYDGYYLVIGTESHKIVSYSSSRVATLDSEDKFFTAPTAGTSVYQVRRLLSACVHPSACGENMFWTEVWSLTGQQQTADTDAWIRATVPLSGHAQPYHVRLRGVRGAAATSDISLDRITVATANTAVSTTSATTKSRRLSYQLVPSSRLYMGLHTSGSPFSLYVRPGPTYLPASACGGTPGCTTPQTLSASSETTLTVTLNDIYGNARSPVAAVDGAVPNTLYSALHEDGIACYLESASDPNMRLYGFVSLVSGAQYQVSFVPSGLDQTATQRTFASSLLYLQLAKAGGLNATYFRGTDLALPVDQRLDATVDFSCTEAPVGTSNVPQDFFSVRWKGLIRAPAVDEVVTFQSTTSTSSSRATGREGVRVWVTGRDVGERSLLIDQWDGMDASYEATLAMKAASLYSIVVEYRDMQSTSAMKLRWKSVSLGGSYAVVPSDRLYYDNDYAFSAPFSVTVTA